MLRKASLSQGHEDELRRGILADPRNVRVAMKRSTCINTHTYHEICLHPSHLTTVV
jgi:hypothetical protein